MCDNKKFLDPHHGPHFRNPESGSLCGSPPKCTPHLFKKMNKNPFHKLLRHTANVSYSQFLSNNSKELLKMIQGIHEKMHSTTKM